MSTPKDSLARVIEATRRICSLPAIPTQTWATDVAQALVVLSPASVVGVVVAQINPETLAIKPISTGLAQSQPDILQALYLQDKLERLSSLELPIPEQSTSRGLVAPFASLHPHWQITGLGRILTHQRLSNPILAIIPITHDRRDFVLICTIASDSEQALEAQINLDSTERTVRNLGQLLPILSAKAKLALEHITDPKAWLTDREHEILDELIRGYSVRVIAEHLGRSAHTVHDHVKNLHKKLHASSRGELIAKALGQSSLSQSQRFTAVDPIVLPGTSRLAESKPIHTNQIAHQEPQNHPKAMRLVPNES